jgi:hypothetical protein
MIRNALLSLTVLAIAGCGCSDDSGGFTVNPSPTQLTFFAGGDIPPIAVPCTPTDGPIAIDVVLLVDDSVAMEGRIPNDGRVKEDVALAIMADVEAGLLADLQAAFPTNTFDLAFAVTRYEDYGGPFRAADALARPFILQQPLLRQAHPAFDAAFVAALERDTPGDALPLDANTVFEALFQIATGAGFDGNGDGDTTDSGPAGALTTQTAPGTSGDVPAADFIANPDPTDTLAPFTIGGLLASGNIGGVGFRPNSLRYVLTTSDISAVAPFAAGAAVPPTVANTPSVPDGCRAAATIPSQAFASSPNTGDPETQRTARFGALPEPVAPTGAATVPQTITSLNGLDIEVLSIGTPRPSILPNPIKPNQPGPVPPGDVAAIPSPANPDPGPFTWMSAVAILTGAMDTDGTSGNMPLVYNMTTVFPFAAAAPTGDVREDMVDRVGACLPFLGIGGDCEEPLDPLVISATFAMPTPGSPFRIVQISGAEPNSVPGPTQTNIQIPRYYQGDPAPAPVRLLWLVVVEAATQPQDSSIEDTVNFLVTPSDVTVDNVQANITMSLPLAPATGTVTLNFASSGCAVVIPEGGAAQTDCE